MSDNTPSAGSIAWIDLTVPNAGQVRRFYEGVAGWSSTPLDMGRYSDYTMQAPGKAEPVAGICHARGENVGLPAQWLVYITVPDLAASLRQCGDLGGKILVGPRDMGEHGIMAVVQDPAGAVAALFEVKTGAKP